MVWTWLHAESAVFDVQAMFSPQVVVPSGRMGFRSEDVMCRNVL